MKRKRMTIAQFLKRLEKTPREWGLQGGAVRCKYSCPIVLVAGKRGTDPRDAQKYGKTLGLRKDVIENIMDASDSRFWGPKKLRNRILRACGLKEGQ